jgi:hypothetical protein
MDNYPRVHSVGKPDKVLALSAKPNSKAHKLEFVWLKPREPPIACGADELNDLDPAIIYQSILREVECASRSDPLLKHNLKRKDYKSLVRAVRTLAKAVLSVE